MFETIYNDFSTKLLPKIAEGLVMTKDYFTDLFGRYVHFLLVRDIIFLSLEVIGLGITLYALYRFIKYAIADEWDNPALTLGIFFILPLTLFTIGIITNITEIVKLKYIPEVVVFEKIKSFNK